MKSYFIRFRVLLLTIAFGLASVSFFNYLSDRWNRIPVDLPQTQSDTPLYVFPTTVLTKQIIGDPKLLNQEKDLSTYDFGGDLTDCNYTPSNGFNECERYLTKARRFIWNHWKQKKLAYLKYNTSGVDAGVDYQIFIEPDETGNWHILWIGERWGAGVAAISNKGMITEDARQVKFKRATKDTYRFDTGIGYLSFTDKHGKEINVL